MHYAQVIHMVNRIIHIALCVAKSAKKFTWTNMALSSDAMNAAEQKAHGKSKNVFRRKKT
jgi:hypothetical protein